MKIYDFRENTLEGVVENINNSPVQGFEELTPEVKAASYAVAAAQGEGDRFEIEAHLDVLLESGAIFNYSSAADLACGHFGDGKE